MEHGGARTLLKVDQPRMREMLASALQARPQGDGPAPAAPSSSYPDAQAHDTLTGTLNHRCFLEALSRSHGQCRRRNQPLSLLLVDLDRFREINQTHSHAVGDRVLAWVGASLKNRCRDGDIVSRYSWDRFAVVLPGTDEGRACEIAERCQARLFTEPLPLDGTSVSVGASIGVAECSPSFVENSGDLIERAEQALAAAKQAGGRRVVGFSTIARETPSRRRLDQASVEAVSRWIGSMRQQLRQAYIESTRALVGAVEAKDPYTRQHSLQVSDYTEELAKRLGLSAAQIESLKTAAVLHDVGKIGVPDAILQRPGRLTAAEFALVKQHPETALQILGHASFLSAELPIILHHHERFDGRGYPGGLAGEQIPFPARILAVADSLDAMASRRSYKEGLSLDRIRSELESCAGKQWDPVVVRAAVEWLDENPNALRGRDHSAPQTDLPSPGQLSRHLPSMQSLFAQPQSQDDATLTPAE